MIFNWAASIVKMRLTETQMYEERDKILKTRTSSPTEVRNQEYARLAYTWAIFYRRFLDKKLPLNTQTLSLWLLGIWLFGLTTFAMGLEEIIKFCFLSAFQWIFPCFLGKNPF